MVPLFTHNTKVVIFDSKIIICTFRIENLTP